MSVREVISIRSPNELLEECVKFTIDDVSKPFVLSGILEPNKEYTFSSWMMSEEGATIVVVDEEISVDTKWSRNKTTFIADTEDLKIYFQYPGIYYFFETQLEEGNIMTGWTPAPEDVDNEFKNYVTTTELNSSIEASASEINLNVSAVQYAVEEVESVLRNTEAKLELKINKDELISEINADANIIRLKSNRLAVESDNLQILEDGTLKTQRGEIGGFVLHDNTLSAEADRHAEINIKYHTYADAEPREGFIKIGNDAENEGGSGEGGICVQDYDLDGNEVYTRIGNVLGGGILIETEEPNDALHIDQNGISRVDGNSLSVNGVDFKGGSSYFNNGTKLYCKTTDGEYIQAIELCNTSNNLTIGHGGYAGKIGNTNIYGNDVTIFSAAAGNVGARPYWRKGDILTYNLRTAGFVTNGGTEVHFTVPLNRMVLGSGLTVTAASTSGFILRQDAKYTHGSASSTYAKPTKYSATIYTNYIYVVATFSSTTNVINNAPCGIVWSGTITIS